MGGRSPTARCMHHWPTRSLCLSMVILQAISINWYLMSNLTYTWAAIYGADLVVVALFVFAFLMASSNIRLQKHSNQLSPVVLHHTPFTYIAWAVYALVLDIKLGVIFANFSTDLDEDSFFGPNTLKTSIALAGIVFLTFLPTNHDVKEGHRKTLIVSLTSTVIFDILDGVDTLDSLFEKETRDAMLPGMADAIIVIICINFLLPTVPLFTLAKTQFGLSKLPERLELLHKFGIAFIINLPLFVIRMITWHGLSQGISIFLLKNIIAMGVVTFELLEHFCVTHKHEHNEQNHDNGRYRSRPNENELTECHNTVMERKGSN
ncbi:hypothetical protein ACF0H5_008829 [Mactra antiquata]